MQKTSQEAARRFIIRYLFRKQYIGAHQTTLENLGRYAREDKRSIEKEALRLAGEGWLLFKKKHYGEHVSINPEKLTEIRAFLEKFQPKEEQNA